MMEKLTSPSEVVGRRIKRAVGVAACAVITGTGGALLMNNAGQTETRIGPATVDVGFEISGNPHDLFGLGGGTRIGVEDMDATFDTHPIGPSVNGTIRTFDLKGIKNAVGPTVTTGQLEQTMQRQISRDINQLKTKKYEVGAKSLGAFALGTLGTAALLQALMWSSREKNRESLREVMTNSASIGAAGALLVGLGGGAATALAYDPSQFASPQKSGAVATAEILAKSSDKIRVADERNANTAVAVLSFINSIEAEAKLEEGIGKPVFSIISIGDNHGVSAASLVNNEATQSTIPIVLFDGGDNTNLGSARENRDVRQQYEEMSEIEKYVGPGNHDQEDTMTELAKVPNTIVVKKGEIATFTVHGLRILAIGDPLYTPEPSVAVPDDVSKRIEQIREDIPRLIREAEERGEPYDIVFTHEPSLLDGLNLGEANILTGHTHHQETSFNDDTWSINPGSTGGAGLRRYQGVTKDSENKTTPRSYTVLSFDESCQLTEAKEVSYRANAAGDEYSVSKEINPNYDETDTSTRCLA